MMQYVKHTVGVSCLGAMQELSHYHWSYSEQYRMGHMQRTKLPPGIKRFYLVNITLCHILIQKNLLLYDLKVCLNSFMSTQTSKHFKMFL